MFSDQNFTSRNNIPSKNDVNFKEFALNDHIEKDNLIINFPIEHEENDLITIENDKEKHKSKGKSVLSLKKFTQTQELQMRNFENIMKENENLTKKNKEYLKEIEFLQKVCNYDYF